MKKLDKQFKISFALLIFMVKEGFLKRVHNVINKADLLLEILDARFPEQTRNNALEETISRKGKKLILVLNKADLISKKKLIKLKNQLSEFTRTVFLSAKEKKGINLLRKEIGIALSGKGVIGVIGYPNTGKSSIINALTGRKAAPTSLKAGFTRGEQRIRLTEKIQLIDTPGIIPFEEKDEFKLILTLSKNPNQISDAEYCAEKLIQLLLQDNAKELEKVYGVKISSEINTEKILEEIALKKNKLIKGGLPDIQNASIQVLMDYQKGKLKLF